MTSRPTARVLALLELLQAGGQHTVPSLAERLDVDERTVRRYAAHLVDLGIPVEVQRGRYGGYRLAPGFKLPPLMLTDDEAVAVMVALATAAGSPGATSAAAKVRRVLPSALAGRISSLISTMDTTAPARRGSAPAARALLGLADAARRHRTVTLAYTAWRGRDSVRGFDPYGLVLHSGRWYVTGWDHETHQIRTFRLDRVRSAHSPRSLTCCLSGSASALAFGLREYAAPGKARSSGSTSDRQNSSTQSSFSWNSGSVEKSQATSTSLY